MCAEWVADPHTRPDVGPLVEGVSPPTCALERRWGRHLHGTTQVPNSLEGQLHVTCVVLCSLRRMVAAQQRERRLVEHARAHNIAIVLSGERLRQGGGGGARGHTGRDTSHTPRLRRSHVSTGHGPQHLLCAHKHPPELRLNFAVADSATATDPSG